MSSSAGGIDYLFKLALIAGVKLHPKDIIYCGKYANTRQYLKAQTSPEINLLESFATRFPETKVEKELLQMIKKYVTKELIVEKTEAKLAGVYVLIPASPSQFALYRLLNIDILDIKSLDLPYNWEVQTITNL